VLYAQFHSFNHLSFVIDEEQELLLHLGGMSQKVHGERIHVTMA